MTCTCLEPCPECGERAYEQLLEIVGGTTEQEFPERETPVSENAPRHSTLEGQLAAFDEHFDHACDLAAHVLLNYRNRIREIARARLIAGYPLYGATMWEWDEDTQWDEALEELADAPNYLGAMLEGRRVHTNSRDVNEHAEG